MKSAACSGVVLAGLIIALLPARPCSAQEQARNYSYLYFEHGFPTQFGGRRPQSEANLTARANPDLVFQTGYYSLMLECDDLALGGYDALAGTDYRSALHEDVTVFTPAQGLLLRVYQGGVAYDATAATVADAEGAYVRLIESGRYVQRVDHHGLEFRSAGGDLLAAAGRLEITAWPDRVTFLLDFSSEVADPITRSVVQVLSPSGEVHLVDEPANRVRLSFMPQEDRALEPLSAEQHVTQATNLQDGSPLAVRFDEDVHAFEVDVPADRVVHAVDGDRVDEYLIEVTNPSGEAANIPLVFDQPIPRAITGTVMLLADATDGRPLGIPVQISKNWHVDPANPTVHEGYWLRGSTMLALAPGEVRRFRLRVVYGYWGGAAAVSHAQLSLIGWAGNGNNWKWEESALGAWGESITYDPAQHAGSSFMADVRPTFTTSLRGGDHDWTENLGGADFLVYRDDADRYRWIKRLKTCFHATGPNMTEVLYSGVTDDDRIRVTYESRAVATRDYHRRFHAYRYEFLQDVVSPRRLLFHQMAADWYFSADFNDYFVGDAGGLITAGTIDAGGNQYKGDPIAFDGRWLAIDDTVTGSDSVHGTRGLISLSSTLNGAPLAVFLHPYGRSWGRDAMLFDLSGAAVTDSYAAGDVVEGELELVIPPKQPGDYWGGDEELAGRLASLSAPWELVADEVRHGVALEVAVHRGSLLRSYPLEIQPADGTGLLADFTVCSGGLGHLPVVLRGAAPGLELKAQRWSETGWTDLEDVRLHDNAYYQATQRTDGSMDYAFSIPRPTADLSESWRVRIRSTENELVSADWNEIEDAADSLLKRDDRGPRRAAGSAWTIDGGVLANSATGNDPAAEGAVAAIIVPGQADPAAQLLELSFDYTTADPAETLIVHLWGYVDAGSAPGTPTMALGGENGDAWESAGGALVVHDLTASDGAFAGLPGAGDTATVRLSGATGAQSYRRRFDLSAFDTAPDTLGGYDFLVIGFARDTGGAAAPAVTISGVVLAAVDPDETEPSSGGVGDSLRVRAPGILSWRTVSGATRHPVLRGTIPATGGLASRPVPRDHSCLAAPAATELADPDSPLDAGRRGFYYLVTAETACGLAAAPLGVDSTGRERESTPCP